MPRIRTSTILMTLACAVVAAAGSAQDRAAAGRVEQPLSASSSKETRTMQIRLKVDGEERTATLLDNATAPDFVSLLPLELTLEDYASTEKIARPPRKLSTAGAPAGVDPDVGDITYYAPWGNLAIFYCDFGYAAGLVKLGRIDGDVAPLAARGAIKVGIEAIANRGPRDDMAP